MSLVLFWFDMLCIQAPVNPSHKPKSRLVHLAADGSSVEVMTPFAILMRASWP